MKRHCSVMIVEPMPLLGEGLVHILWDLGFNVVGRPTTYQSALQRLKRAKPHFIILDPDALGPDVAGAIRILRDLSPETRIVLLRTRPDGQGTRWTGRAGIDCCVNGFGCVSNVRRAFRRFLTESEMRASHDGRGRVPGPATGRNVLPSQRARNTVLAKLTKREADVLPFLAHGVSVKETAEQLGLAPKTVDAHKTHLMAKLGVHNAVELARLAIRERIVPL